MENENSGLILNFPLVLADFPLVTFDWADVVLDQMLLVS